MYCVQWSNAATVVLYADITAEHRDLPVSWNGKRLSQEPSATCQFFHVHDIVLADLFNCKHEMLQMHGCGVMGIARRTPKNIFSCAF